MVGLPRQYIRYPDGGIEDVKLDDADDIAWYAEWFNDPKNRKIARTAVPYGEDMRKAVIISTVFLGFEHGTIDGEPILWETLASMPADHDDLEARYTSEANALAGHADIAKRVDAILNIDYYEIEQLVDDLAKIPKPGKVKLKQAKGPNKKAPNPSCNQCNGTGKTIGMFGESDCECTVVKRAVPQIKGPKTKDPDPNCFECGGTGEPRNSVVPDTLCECTIVKRSQNAEDDPY